VVTADQRRQAVRLLQERFAVSERRACRVLGQQRSTQRQRPKKAQEGEQRLVARMLELVRQHPRYGYRRVWALLRREGWRVNRQRVYRLWRKEGLRVPRKQRKKRRLGSSANSCVRRPAVHKNHVWAWDFLHDRTSDGRPLKWFTLVDEYTRECLALEVGRGMTARAVSQVLAGVVRERGSPAHIRSDNGPEFIAKGIRAWMSGAGLEALYIEPGAPWENGYAESFNSKVRDELLNAEEFGSVLEAKVLAKEWRRDYNHVRPHSALGYRAPAEFGAMAPRADSAALRRPEEPSVTVDPTLTAPGP
jgi:putative transposase